MTGVSIETLELWASSLWEARQRIRKLSLLAGAMSPAEHAASPRQSRRTSAAFHRPQSPLAVANQTFMQVAVYVRRGVDSSRSAKGRLWRSAGKVGNWRNRDLQNVSRQCLLTGSGKGALNGRHAGAFLTFSL